jgi:hypothetical protein
MMLSPAINRFATGLAALALAVSPSMAQEDRSESLTEPVYRVSHETPATQVSARAVPTSTADGFFDLEQRDGEHPLAPSKRFAERVLSHIDANVKDYACLFSKLERIDGEMQEPQYIAMKAMHDPFSVHLMFKKPKKGQECLYVEGANDNKLKARAHGWRGSIAGVLTLDPEGSLAMDGQKYPIYKAGIRNLTTELIRIIGNDLKYGECEVQNYPDVKLGDRQAVMIEVTHPVPRKEFKFHKARIYVDKELKIPVRYEAYNWNKDDKGKPELEELYMYTNLSINNGYSANFFSESNPEIFQ